MGIKSCNSGDKTTFEGKKISFAMGSNCSKRSKCFYLIKGRNFYQLTKNICKLVKGGTAATSEMVISIFCDSICKKWKFRNLTSGNIHLFNGFNGCKEWQCCNLIGENFHPNKSKVKKRPPHCVLISTFYDGLDGCIGWKCCKLRCGYFHPNKL